MEGLSNCVFKTQELNADLAMHIIEPSESACFQREIYKFDSNFLHILKVNKV